MFHWQNNKSGHLKEEYVQSQVPSPLELLTNTLKRFHSITTQQNLNKLKSK